MSMVGFPLLLIPLAIYNIIVFLMPGVSLAEPVFKLTLVSGAEWPLMLSGRRVPALAKIWQFDLFPARVVVAGGFPDRRHLAGAQERAKSVSRHARGPRTCPGRPSAQSGTATRRYRTARASREAGRRVPPAGAFRRPVCAPRGNTVLGSGGAGSAARPRCAAAAGARATSGSGSQMIQGLFVSD